MNALRVSHYRYQLLGTSCLYHFSLSCFVSPAVYRIRAPCNSNREFFTARILWCYVISACLKDS
uniref:Uncharacterized protein n=1 Tax=Pfiesteria piscicida TaxID=71001 RepID=E8Z6B0_PFIPI|nr:unknown [Pfiesteria piscicida]ACU45074.1 unknown [Pfiesteria piscicida]